MPSLKSGEVLKRHHLHVTKSFKRSRAWQSLRFTKKKGEKEKEKQKEKYLKKIKIKRNTHPKRQAKPNQNGEGRKKAEKNPH